MKPLVIHNPKNKSVGVYFPAHVANAVAEPGGKVRVLYSCGTEQVLDLGTEDYAQRFIGSLAECGES